MRTITVKDENLAGEIIKEFQLSFEKEHVSIREIISVRVHSEVNAYNSNEAKNYNGLVMPTKEEQILNTSKSNNIEKIDAEKQVYLTWDGFMKNAFFVLVDNLQVEHLDQVVEISPDSQVSFLKLTPLVGG